ncbi:MAG: hypothetical protein J6U49_06625 [Alistipes sp.]|nr:hypothetical protein [Alistipes sp.]
MKGEELIKYIQQRPLLLSEDIKFTLMALLNDRLINPSALIDAQYAIKDEECKKYRLHWQEANIAANILMTGNKEQKESGRVRLMYNSLADTTIPYKKVYADKLSDTEMGKCREFFLMMYGFNGE